MPVQPRIARATPEGTQTWAPEPIPVWVILRWYGRPAEKVPGHAHAWTGGRSPAVLVEWEWRHPQGGRRQDWFASGDVLRHDPSAEEFLDLVARPTWRTASRAAGG